MFLIGLALAGSDEVCTGFAETPASTTIEDIPYIESSGVAVARGQDDIYYTHDDSGGDAALYVFHGDGSYVGLQTIRNATNTDWEDIAAGPCPATVDATDCIWIADTGDNDKARDDLTLWVVPESTAATEDAVGCPIAYPNGEHHDAEALLVGPDGVVRIVTKSGDGDATVYRLTNPRCDGGEAQTLAKEAQVTLDEPVTGGAMNAAGTSVVLRSLSKAWLWNGCTLSWGDDPTLVDLGSQPQGEAVDFDSDGSLVTTSESTSKGDPQRFWKTPCASTEPLECPACGCGGGGAGLVFLLPLGAFARRRARRDRRSV